MKLRPFVKHYLIAALWSSTDPNDDPLDDNYSLTDCSPELIAQAEKDCAEFEEKAGPLLDLQSDEQNGHDFWLTRNRHGVGFWDRGLGLPGDMLTKIAHSFGEINIYVGDDGKLYTE